MMYHRMRAKSPMWFIPVESKHGKKYFSDKNKTGIKAILFGTLNVCDETRDIVCFVEMCLRVLSVLQIVLRRSFR